ncbi:hypothetical protein BDFB_000257, partial [Asbolus verrucosus]
TNNSLLFKLSRFNPYWHKGLAIASLKLFLLNLFMELHQEKPQFVKTFTAFLSCDHVTRHKTTSLFYLKCCSVVRFPYGRGHICPPLNPYIPNLVSAPD